MTKAERVELRRTKWLTPAIPQEPRSVQIVSTQLVTTVADETQATPSTPTERKVSLSVKKGSTRGKNPREIEYMAFDLAKPETLPVSLAEFTAVTKTPDEKTLVEYLIGGYNDAMYSAASDEIGEFINDEWLPEIQAQFRLAVRNYSKLTSSTIEDAVALIKPGVEKAWVARKAKMAEDAAKPKEEVKEAVPA